ncbi:hypothetical protein N9R79_11940 [Vibrio sp.]|nr:hypothetical protein [Vibrio sp.]
MNISEVKQKPLIIMNGKGDILEKKNAPKDGWNQEDIELIGLVYSYCEVYFGDEKVEDLMFF